MKTRTFRFKTREEATAFVEGVEYVNDSAIEVLSITSHPGRKKPWVVVVQDEDGDE